MITPRFNDLKAANKANSKIIATSLLRSNSIPVADSHIWSNKFSFKENIDLVNTNLGYPVVVKPVYGHKGYSVTAGISNAKELTSAVQALLDKGKSVLIDKHLNGDEYRIMVYDGEIIGVTKRSNLKLLVTGNIMLKA